MAHNPITLDLLRALDAIEQRGSFAAAAQALHKVPSALTYTIQKVEQDLGIDLFDRSGHRAKMTPAAKLMLDEGRSILRDIDALASSAKKIASGWEPELRIGIDTVFEPSRLFPLIKAFSEEHPFIKVHLIHGSLTGTWEMLLNSSADLILSVDNLNPRLEGYQVDTIGPMRSVFVVARDHPLALRACEVSEDEIAEYPTIVVKDTSQLMTPKTIGWARRNRLITVPDMAEKVLAQLSGLGVGYLPMHRIKTYLDTGQLVPINVKEPEHSYHAVVAWKDGEEGQASAWFRERLTAACLGIDRDG
ncbi:MAG: LysR family transcriptional regulator [Saccharospirillum sp.]|nr:LysR family transcriptional regulator [Saccharospirillum sp.]